MGKRSLSCCVGRAGAPEDLHHGPGGALLPAAGPPRRRHHQPRLRGHRGRSAVANVLDPYPGSRVF